MRHHARGIRLHPHRACGVVALLACLHACGPRADLESAELYGLVLAAVSEELDAPRTMAIHPRLARWPPLDSGSSAALTEFNAFDSVSVPEVVRAGRGAYDVCDVSASGSCRVGPDGVAIVLSEIHELGRNGIAVLLTVADGRPGRDFHRRYLARVKRGITGWSVVELTPTDR